MAVLRVGMRVRCARAVNPFMRGLVGVEGFICAEASWSPGAWVVTGAEVASDGIQCAWSSSDLEPILPDGHRAGDYSNVRDLMDALSQGVSA